MESFRHGIQVLNLADVTQLDWHCGQILLHTDVITKIDHAVLIDFADTFQTIEIEIINHALNYSRALYVFETEFDLDQQWVLDHFGKPDYWDSTHSIIQIDGKFIVLEAPLLFPYISAA